MKRNIVCVLLALVMMMTMGCAYAEQAEAAVPSKTVANLTVSNGTQADDGVVIYVSVLETESEEAAIFEEMKAAAQASAVTEYFDAATQVQMATVLPEQTDLQAFQMEEFFNLEQEGYEAEHGDLTATFEFVTPYEEKDVLIAMVGLLPKAEAEGAEEAETVWYPQQAVVVEGKVQVIFTQEVLTLMQEQEAVLVLLRAYQPEIA